MLTHNKRLLHLMFVGCTLAASVFAAQAQAEGNGVIVLNRDVKTRPAIRSDRPDPDPTTVNTNASARVLSQTNELSDGDFAGVASGSSVGRIMIPNASGARVVNSVPSTLPGMGSLGAASGGGGAGAGAGISNRVGAAVGAGLAPLQMLTGGAK
ncbi:hypothetical protein V0R50_22735 [Pseudomonas sp. 148P]|uniref:Fap n=1 Tax=Pseudomonas ulcerans TaxID=3115852 RepID=A0ABU7HWW2_9PSED|nr:MULTISPECIES: hypothetical protein [unclassified Pseudomonas]MEE1924397.1 hypothetical protein [Pseudomonas sp. 147P]MEE1936052.1 hypothetical protein [Pseudomonas sp. 148P]